MVIKRKPPERVLIVGSYVTPGKIDRRKLRPNSLGIDMRYGPGVDIVWNLENGPPPSAGLFDLIECWSVLEHAKRPWLVAHTLEGMLAEKGTLSVKVPFVWRFHAYPSDYWRFTIEGVKLIFPRIKWSKVALMQAMKSRGESETFQEIAKTRGKVDVMGQVALYRSEVWGVGRLHSETPDLRWFESGSAKTNMRIDAP